MYFLRKCSQEKGSEGSGGGQGKTLSRDITQLLPALAGPARNMHALQNASHPKAGESDFGTPANQS